MDLRSGEITSYQWTLNPNNVLVIKERQTNIERMDLRSGETTSCQSTLNSNKVFA